LLAIVCLLQVSQAEANNGWVFCKTGSFPNGLSSLNFNKLADCGFDDFEKIRLLVITPMSIKVRVSFDGGVYRTVESHAAGVYLNYLFSGPSTSISLNAVGSSGSYEIEAYRPSLDFSIQGLNLPPAAITSSNQFSAAASGFVSGGLLLVLLIYFNGLQMFMSALLLLMRIVGLKL